MSLHTRNQTGDADDINFTCTDPRSKIKLLLFQTDKLYSEKVQVQPKTHGTGRW